MFTFILRQGLHCGCIFEGVELVEDVGYFPTGEDFLAGIPDPWRPIGQHCQFLDSEQAVPVLDLLRVSDHWL